MQPGESALARIRADGETIESAYRAWAELQLEQRAAKAHFAAELRRLDEQGSLVLGAVRRAQAPNLEEGLERYLSDSRTKLDVVRHQLERQEAEAKSGFENALHIVRSEVRRRVERVAKMSPPRMRVTARSMPAGRRILHAGRVSGDEAVTLCSVLSTEGQIPSRYGFLFDDTIDDVTTGEPAWLYADEGIEPGQTRPSPAVLTEVLAARHEVWPLKGVVVMARGARWRQRGPVMEVEVADAETTRNLLTQTEAEEVLGSLLSLKLAGRLELELTSF